MPAGRDPEHPDPAGVDPELRRPVPDLLCVCTAVPVSWLYRYKVPGHTAAAMVWWYSCGAAVLTADL